MKIANAELKVVRFGAEDVIATSYFFFNTGSGYTSFNGEMTHYDESAEGWHINVVGDVNTSSAEERAQFIDEKSPISYDAYQYDSSDRYYTKGASYYEL